MATNFDLPKAYDPKAYEQDIYQLWEKAEAFAPNEEGDDVFATIAPPPNATGKLHLGHVLGAAIKDTVVRFMRMNGKATLYLPGTDHAAIATNAVVERQLKEEGKSKHDIGRQAFIKRVEDYIAQSQGSIAEQYRAVGASMDWTRERYTLEPAMNNIVNKVFAKMYHDGLIYRGSRIVNWDVVLQTTVSDDELEYSEENDKFYTFQYGPFQIGTARPETKFGDKYVVVHPDDDRYKNFEHGQTFEAEWINGPITATVIKDDCIDMEFGTGAMTITPWHDATDFEIAERHELDREQIIGLDGKLLEVAGEFAGMDILEAREKIADKLDKKGLLVEVEENYKHRVARSDRGKGVVEPQIMAQWFIDVNKPALQWKGKKLTLKEVMQDAVRSSDIEIIPQRFENMYFSWIDNLRDWCISRQIWFGHQIPAWTREVDGKQEVHVDTQPPEGEGWRRDPDNLDTWFSSAFWTFSTLFDPEVASDPNSSFEQMMSQSTDFQRFHPTNFMENGYDIIFFWDARMILMTTYITGQIPFKTLYLHGMVQDKDGKKMSKSRPETSIEPQEAIEKFGADALRLSMLNGLSPGNNMRLFDEKIKGNRNFCNKLWNIARFITTKLDENFEYSDEIKPQSAADFWILNRLNMAIEQVSEDLANYRVGSAYDTVYHFIWDDFADWYIEASKSNLNVSVLTFVFNNILRLTHPFAPFVTEALWRELSFSNELLITTDWPRTFARQETGEEFDEVKNVITELRRIATVVDVSNAALSTTSSGLRAHQKIIAQLSPVKAIVDTGKTGLQLTSADAVLGLSSEEVMSYQQALQKQLDNSKQQCQTLELRLSNKKYVSSAPPSLVQETKDQLKDQQQQVEILEQQIKQLQ